MLIGIIGAMRCEIAELMKCISMDHSENISHIDFCSGKINDISVILAACGIGKVHAAICTQTMILKYSPDIIINTGVAGSLSPALDIGACAIASSVVEYDAERDHSANPLSKAAGVNFEYRCDSHVVEKLVQSMDYVGDTRYQVGLIATGDRFVNSKEEKNQILHDFSNAIACDMESGSIGHVCCVNKKLFGIIRSICDNADHTPDIDIEAFIKLASTRAARVVKRFLEIVNQP